MINRQNYSNHGQGGYYQGDVEDPDYSYDQGSYEERWQTSPRRANEGGAFQQTGGPAYYSQSAGSYGRAQPGFQSSPEQSYQPEPAQPSNANYGQWQRGYGGPPQSGYGHNTRQFAQPSYGGSEFTNYYQGPRQQQNPQNRNFGNRSGYQQAGGYGQQPQNRGNINPYIQHHSGAFRPQANEPDTSDSPYGAGSWGSPYQSEYGVGSLGREFGSNVSQYNPNPAAQASYGAGSYGYGHRSEWSNPGSGIHTGRPDNASYPNRKGPKGYKRSDERIKEDVCDCLMHAWHINPEDIEVDVSQCEVTLTGTVDSRREKFQAEEAAAGVLGVTDVTNNLRVNGDRWNDEDNSNRSSSSRPDAIGAAGKSGRSSQQSTQSSSTNSGSRGTRSTSET